MKTLKSILIGAFALSFLACLIYIYAQEILIPKRYVVEDSTIVLEKINKVLKLVAVEGQFSEIDEHEEWYGYNISPFRKKTLIRINAKVLVGFDLEKMNMQIDEKSRTIYIDAFPSPEILSMDDDIEYYDITEGLFTSFSKDDYTAIQKKAEIKIKEIAASSGLIEKAEEQKEDILSLLELSLEKIGWQLRIKEAAKSLERLQ